MLESIKEFIDGVLALVLLPATLYGAGGAFMSAKRKKEPLRQTVISVIGGIITTNALSPLVQDLSPESWHTTLFFLTGWGGLELVSQLYEVAAGALAKRLGRKIGGE
jgi:hypothetical protein